MNCRTASLRPSFLGAVFCVLLLTLAVGCNSNGLVPVAGQVTLDGNPVPKGRVEFFPETGRPAVGQLDSEGRYQLMTFEPKDGAKPGNYVVTVTAIQEATGGPEYSSIEDEFENAPLNGAPSNVTAASWLVPPRYSRRVESGLTAVVDGDTEINFDLKTEL